MGLRETIQDAVESGVNALGDVPVKCTYTQITPVQGAPGSATNTYTSIPVIFDEFTADERENLGITANLQKAMIAKGHLAAEPELHDTITKPDTSVWRVEKVMTDPAEAMWVLALEKP